MMSSIAGLPPLPKSLSGLLNLPESNSRETSPATNTQSNGSPYRQNRYSMNNRGAMPTSHEETSRNNNNATTTNMPPAAFAGGFPFSSGLPTLPTLGLGSNSQAAATSTPIAMNSSSSVGQSYIPSSSSLFGPPNGGRHHSVSAITPLHPGMGAHFDGNRGGMGGALSSSASSGLGVGGAAVGGPSGYRRSSSNDVLNSRNHIYSNAEIENSIRRGSQSNLSNENLSNLQTRRKFSGLDSQLSYLRKELKLTGSRNSSLSPHDWLDNGDEDSDGSGSEEYYSGATDYASPVDSYSNSYSNHSDSYRNGHDPGLSQSRSPYR